MEQTILPVNQVLIEETLATAIASPNAGQVEEILQKALAKKGLATEDAAVLLNVSDKALLEKMFAASLRVKQEIYGNRIVFFAPLYLSNLCSNECAYCAFHASNNVERKKLSMQEIAQQTQLLLKMGHKRLLLESGEHPENSIDFVVDAIKTIYATSVGREKIRRVNINIAATTVENYKKLKEAGIGTYQLFQETYHKPTFEKVHKGPKANYERQIFALNKAFEAGIDDLGIGALFGLHDWKFEVLALITHSQYLEKTLGVGPHTISIPRLRKAQGTSFPLNAVPSDKDFLKIIAVLRLAVPYTGMIISTREAALMREKALQIGVTQASAASATSPGGYGKEKELSQFQVADERTLSQVVESICAQGLMPSFCTACYRSGRTGDDFMALAKTGKIQELCLPNALLTFKEYLLDHGTSSERELGEKMIKQQSQNLSSQQVKKEFWARIKKLEQGERDLYF